MKPSALTLFLAAIMGSIAACGGTALDLDRQAPSDSPQAGAPPNIIREAIEVDDGISSLSADDSSVYWVTGVLPQGKLRSRSFEDCAATSTTYAAARGPVLLTSNDLLFPSPQVMNPIGESLQSLLHCSKAGCGGIPTEFVNDPNVGAYIADAEWLYWASKFDIYRCSLAGCGEVPERVAARLSDDASLPGPTGFALSTADLELTSDAVYWVAGQVVYSAAKDGSRPATRVISFESSYPSIAVDERNLYWVDGSSQIVSCHRSRCNDAGATRLVTTNTTKYQLYVDERGLFWFEHRELSDRVSNAIYFCPLSGCAEPQRLTSESVLWFTFSEHYLYWTESPPTAANGAPTTIFRTPKPNP